MLSLLTSMLLAMFAVQSPARLAVIRDVPGFNLEDQNGKSVESRQLKGKVLLVSFVFTTCNGSCPATTHRMAKIQQALKQAGMWDPDNVQFLSITLDPARDAPEVLQKYMKLYDISDNGWSFLTGSPETVAKTISDWNMWVKAAPNGQLDHPSRIFLLDRQQRVREIYNTELLTVDDVCRDIRTLVEGD